MASRMPAALRERLGESATLELLEVLESQRNAWSEHVLTLAADRFERRLTEQVSTVRVELHDGLASVRVELHDGLASVRTEFHDGLASVRSEFHDGLASVRSEFHDRLASVRSEIHNGLASVRSEIATTRVDLLKWSFAFWVGQVAVMAGLLSLMLRSR